MNRALHILVLIIFATLIDDLNRGVGYYAGSLIYGFVVGMVLTLSEWRGTEHRP